MSSPLKLIVPVVVGISAFLFLKSKKEQNEIEHHVVQRVNSDPRFYREQMDRTILFFEEGFDAIKDSFVVVVGLGGVGSAAAHILLRSGVGKLRLIDPDVVTLSSLNRNALAQRSDVGRSKVSVMKDYFERICPEAEVEIFETFYEGHLSELLLAGKPDYVLDCIDDRSTKLELMTYCYRNNIKVLSSFGAGGCSDPTSVKVNDISISNTCPFGRVLRRSLLKEGISTGILCVYSTQSNKKKLILHQDDYQRLKEQDICRKVRVGTLPVTMVMPTTFGSIAANTILHELAGVAVPLSPDEESPYLSLAKKMHNRFIRRTLKNGEFIRAELETAVSVTDIFELLEHFNHKTALSGEVPKCIVQWRADKPLSGANIIPVTNKEESDHRPSDLSSYTDSKITEIDNTLLQFAASLSETYRYSPQ